MKWRDFCSSGIGSVVLYFAWHVFEGGRVVTRSGYSSMTREANPLAFWFEIAAFTFIGASLLAYGLAGLFGYANVTSKMDIVADRFSVLKFQTLLVFVLLVMLVASLGWLVIDELMRTSRVRAGGG